jgi:hypothetical protein
VDDRRDVWIAFVLSIAVPGAGQLWKAHWSGVAWLLSAAMLIVFWALVRENMGTVWSPLQYASFLILGLVSGLHASRVAARTAESR